jgi:colanic acid/amylovoran biosynthesis glycosyltransferase
LRERGFDVSVVCDRVRIGAGVDAGAEPFCSLLAKTRTRWLCANFFHAVLARLPGRLRGLLTAGLDLLHDWRLNRYDLLIAHFGWSGLRLARSRAFGLLRKPFATFFHGYDVGIPLHAGRMHTYAALFGSRQLLLSVNQYFRNVLLENGADPSHVDVFRMGVDCEAISFAVRPRADVLQCITVCRIVEKKGIEFAIRALGELQRRRPDLRWVYTLIGDGPLRDSLEKLTQNLGLMHQVHFTGALAHEDVKTRLKEAHVFLLPSVTAANGDVEGVPVALMEAMAAGLPVVSSRHSGIPELITHQRTGLLAPEKDFLTLSKHLEWIADHPAECEAMTRAAREAVERNFNNRLLNDRLASLINSLTGFSKSTHL